METKEECTPAFTCLYEKLETLLARFESLTNKEKEIARHLSLILA